MRHTRLGRGPAGLESGATPRAVRGVDVIGAGIPFFARFNRGGLVHAGNPGRLLRRDVCAGVFFAGFSKAIFEFRDLARLVLEGGFGFLEDAEDAAVVLVRWAEVVGEQRADVAAVFLVGFLRALEERGVLQVAGGGLERVEDEACGLVVDESVEQSVDDFAESVLDGVGVLGEGDVEGCA
ncbi:MAG TPA: hypothetical protein VD837_10340 [Terriglobales bacterium]|nr:hypothetical protein [Terriglobales bacterium]